MYIPVLMYDVMLATHLSQYVQLKPHPPYENTSDQDPHPLMHLLPIYNNIIIYNYSFKGYVGNVYGGS